MILNEQEQYILINANEEAIKVLARDLIKHTDMCRCEKCFKDVCAIALNNFNGHYVTSRKGAAIASALNATAENRSEMVIAVSKAIKSVQDTPRHM